MALDYTMTRDAVNAAVQSDLLNANRIGQSAAQLGYLGADAFKELGLGQGGLFNLLKGRQNPFTQESVDTTPNTQFGNYGDVNPMDVPMDQRVSFEDPNRVYDQPNMDILSQVPTHEAKQGLINSKEYVSLMAEMILWKIIYYAYLLFLPMMLIPNLTFGFWFLGF